MNAKTESRLNDDTRLNKEKYMYCKYCGAKIDVDSVFCNSCGKKVVSTDTKAHPKSETVYLFDDIDGNPVRVPESKLASWEEAQSETHKPLTETEKLVRDRIVNDIFNSSSKAAFNEESAPKKKSFSKEWLVIASILLAISLIVYSFVNEPVSIDDISPSTAPTPSPISTPSQYPLPVSNGQIFKLPEYVGVCPLTVSARGTNSYFVYLKYIEEPYNSKENRTLKHDDLTIQRERITESVPSITGEKFDDISFYVSGDSTANIEIPIGIYQLYFACGKTWFGSEDLFGDETTYYTTDNLLNFFFDGDDYNGYTLEIQSQNVGSFEADAIDKSEFPG